MSLNLYNAFYEDNVLYINNIANENSRALNKVKIYLGSKNEFNFKINDGNIIVTFKVQDQKIVFQQITSIMDYIAKTLNVKIKLSEKLESNINFSKKSEENFSRIIKELNQLKRDENFEDNKNFKDFCYFSDETLSCKLRDYQYKAAYFLSIGNGGFDFSVPGAGKTIISYATYNYYKSNGIANSILIIGPINSFNAWYEEYYTCFGKKPDFTSLAELSSKDAFNYLLSTGKNHSEITFINIDKAWRFTNEIIKFLENKDTLLIIDEAHKQKNPDAKITKSVLEITKYVKTRIILTGTPLPNGYEDLFTITKIYSPYENLLPYGYGHLKRLTKNGATNLQEQRIIDSIYPVYSRVSKKYLYETKQLQLPNTTFIVCELSKEQQNVYDFLNEIAFHIIDDFESSLNLNLMKAILIRKMQVSANPGLLTKSIINSIDEYKNEYISEFYDDDNKTDDFIIADKKISELISKSSIVKTVFNFETNQIKTPKNLKAVEIAKQLVDKGEKVIIWDTFVQNMETLRLMFSFDSNYKVELINGSVTGEDRNQALNNFRYGDSMILIANPSTLAESISLHKSCQNAIYVNRNYNAAQFMQSKDRIHRINMPINKTANYYYLINENTVDEEVHARLDLKEKRMLKILDSDKLEIGNNEFDSNSFMNNEDIINSYRK